MDAKSAISILIVEPKPPTRNNQNAQRAFERLESLRLTTSGKILPQTAKAINPPTSHNNPWSTVPWTPPMLWAPLISSRDEKNPINAIIGRSKTALADAAPPGLAKTFSHRPCIVAIKLLELARSGTNPKTTNTAATDSKVSSTNAAFDIIRTGTLKNKVVNETIERERLQIGEPLMLGMTW